MAGPTEDAFYLPLGDNRYVSTGHTAGPWSPDSQHLGPPSALLARELERCAPRLDSTLARLTVEILGPVPLAELTVHARVERPGRSVELLSAELAAGSRPVVRAWAWRIAGTDTSAEVTALPPALPMSGPDAEPAAFPGGWLPGYVDAMEWISVGGGLGEIGPGRMWGRQRVALVDGEKPTGLQRLMTVADSASGIGNRLDIAHWLFINTELTVHLWREPVGEWIGVDSDTTVGPTGVGTAASVLHDGDGPVGRTAQALLIRPR